MAQAVGPSPQTRDDGAERARSALVGVDDSLSARLALDEAAERVGPGGRLVLAHALGLPLPEPLPGALPTPVLGDLEDERREVGRRLLERIAGDVEGRGVDTRLLDGDAARALALAAAEADVDELVVGSRGLGRFVAALGSVSHALLHEADRPVVVVPRSAADTVSRRRPLGRRVVVVGYDGSPTRTTAGGCSTRSPTATSAWSSRPR